MISFIMKIEGDELVLVCTGDDPGLTFDHLADLKGLAPWRLTFRLLSQAGGAGDVFFTTDAKTTLPKGLRQSFDVIHDGQWHSHDIILDNAGPVYGIRLDPCSGPGIVRIKGLTLQDGSGKTLCIWPDIAP